MWQVYIIRSNKKRWYYVGSTNRLKERLSEHNSGKVKSTKTFAPFKIVFKKDFSLESEARGYERLIKDKRTLKESLIKEIECREQSWGIV